MNHTHTVIFSAWRAGNDLITNMEASEKARLYLGNMGVAYWDAIGAYQEEGHTHHTQEVSHVVHCSTKEQIEFIKEYAHNVLNQDCILVIENQCHGASLLFPQHTALIGTLKEVDETTAHANECYTYFMGDYFICS